MLTSVISQFVATDNADKGLEFENFVLSRFNNKHYEILIRPTRSVYNPPGHNPHLLYYSKKDDMVFALECRFRQSDYRNKFTWAEPDQLTQYSRFEETSNAPLFVVIGLGGLPFKPTHVFIIPFKDIRDATTLDITRITDWERSIAGNEFIFDGERRLLA